MKPSKPFIPVKSWGIKPVTWGIVHNPSDEWWIQDLKTRKEAKALCVHLNYAYEFGRLDERHEANDRAQKIMDKLGI